MKNEVIVRLNGKTVKTLSNYIYGLAERGYKIHIRSVSLLDFIPSLPLVSRLFRLVLFRTGLWKKTLWVELSITTN
jgi:hypothetical protein